MNLKRKVINLAVSSLLALNIYGCSNNPTAPESPQHIEIQSSTTDKEGYATLNNDESQLKVRCVSQTGQPIQNVQVYYNNGTAENRYEVLSFLPQTNHRPITRFYTTLNNKIDIVETLQNLNDSDYILRQITGTDEKAALRNFLNFYLTNINNSLLQSSFRYGGTFTGEQLRDSYRLTINTLLFVGSNVSGGPVPINEVLSGINEDISLEDILSQAYNLETNWDVYWFSPFGLPIKAFHVLMPSNKPTITQNNPQVSGSNVSLSWQGQDARNYFQNLIPIPDPTIKFGPTPNSDLFYTIKLFRNNQLYATFGTNQTSKSVTNLPEGSYRSNIEVVDDTNINVTSTTDTGSDKTFAVGSTPTIERIVFTRGEEVYSISPNGSNLTRVESGTNPSINPINNSVALERVSGTKREIFIRYSNGSLEQITNSTNSSGAPSFDWQGNRLVYIKDADLYTTNLSTGLESAVITNGSPQEPSLSQVGDKVVFSTNLDGNWEIYSANINGTNAQRLTNDSRLDTEPNLNRDSTRIAFTKNDDIWVMNSDGTNQTNITNTSATIERQPCFSPDGSKIVFAKWSGYWDLYIMNNDGSNQINLTNTSNVSELQPDWK